MPQVLIHTSDALARATLSGTCEVLGVDFKVTTSSDGALMGVRGGAVTLVVLDLMLPGRGSGIDLARTLQAESPRLLTFYFLGSSSGEAEFFVGAPLELHLGGLLSRPLFPGDALEKLGRVLPPPEGDLLSMLARIPSPPEVDLLSQGPFDLTQIPASRLLFAASQDRTGVLSLNGMEVRGELAFQGGRLAGIEGAGSGFSLIRSWVQGEMERPAHLGNPPAPGDVDAEIGYLIAARALPPHRAEEAVRVAAADLLGRVARVPSGAGRWVEGGSLARRLPSPLPVFRLLLEGKVRRGESGDAGRLSLPSDQVAVIRLPAQAVERSWGLTPREVQAIQRLRPLALRNKRVSEVVSVFMGEDPGQYGERGALLSVLMDVGVVGAVPPPMSPSSWSKAEELAHLHHRLQSDDHFEALGVSPDASPEHLKASFLDLTKRHHPDLFHSEHPRVVDLSRRIQTHLLTAYETLSDPQKKKGWMATGTGGGEEGGAPVVTVDPKMARIEFKQGELALRNGKLEKACAHLEMAVKLDPDSPQYRAMRAWSQLALDPGRVGVTVQELRQILDTHPRIALAHLYLGHIAKKQQEWGRAMKYYRSAMEADPKLVDAERELRLLKRRQEKGELSEKGASPESGSGWSALKSLFGGGKPPVPPRSRKGNTNGEG